MTDLLLDTVDRARLADLARRSHAVITGLQDAGGAYPACPTFPAYAGYAWLRDGAFTAEGVSRYGDATSADRFHDWVCDVLARRTDQVVQLVAEAAAGEKIGSARMLPTRFTFEGDNGTDPWWDFQTDGYGIWLWSVVEHAERHGKDLSRWSTGMAVAVDYLAAFWDRPCYDWWEEHPEQRHVSTLGAIYGGLTAVARSGALGAERSEKAATVAASVRGLALLDGVTVGRAANAGAPHLAKWLGSGAVDASLIACVTPFGLVPPGSAVAVATLDAVERDLELDGGVHRFRADVFYGGGQWLLLACLLGWSKASAGDTTGALRHLLWVADHATPDGEMPEQVPDHLLEPSSRNEWLVRWGPVATPLLWSHGMYLILADVLGLLPEASTR
jgi:GH15 family glucan-1,4-alpha-glucosidase